MPRPLRLYGERAMGYGLSSAVLNPILGIRPHITQHDVFVVARTKAAAIARAQEARIRLTPNETRILMGNDVDAMTEANLLVENEIYASSTIGTGSSVLVRVLARDQFEVIGEFKRNQRGHTEILERA